MKVERTELIHAPNNILYTASEDNFYYKQVFSKVIPIDRIEAFFEIQAEIAYEEHILIWKHD